MPDTNLGYKASDSPTLPHLRKPSGHGRRRRLRGRITPRARPKPRRQDIPIRKQRGARRPDASCWPAWLDEQCFPHESGSTLSRTAESRKAWLIHRHWMIPERPKQGDMMISWNGGIFGVEAWLPHTSWSAVMLPGLGGYWNGQRRVLEWVKSALDQAGLWVHHPA